MAKSPILIHLILVTFAVLSFSACNFSDERSTQPSSPSTQPNSSGASGNNTQKKTTEQESKSRTTSAPPTAPGASQPPSTVTQVKFSKVLNEVLKDSCLRCHNQKKQKGDVDLSSYKSALNVVLLNDPLGSILYKVIVPNDNGNVSMPEDGSPLPSDKTELVKKWIQEGAVE